MYGPERVSLRHLCGPSKSRHAAQRWAAAARDGGAASATEAEAEAMAMCAHGEQPRKRTHASKHNHTRK